MTQIQLIDLCSRVPYHPKGHVVNACNGAECDEWLTCATFPMFTSITNNSRLYLRPMSDMTEDEKKELNNVLEFQYYSDDSCMCESTDWLNAHHFDFRNLIGRGLALEAPNGMYDLEKK